MSEPENFLSRWSRRKLEAEQEQRRAAGRDAEPRQREHRQTQARRMRTEHAREATPEQCAE